MATRSGTWDYYDRFTDDFGRTYFRRFPPGVSSSIGLGTYGGEPTDELDDRYREALVTGLESGSNHLDTAINYRCERSERVVGAAIREATVDREEVVVATKGGYLPFDEERPAEPARAIRDRFIDPGIVHPDDLAGGRHCLDPAYLSWSLDRSLENLGLETVDCFYVHNPETQLDTRSRAAVYDQLEAAFTRLEEHAAAGEIGSYGVATWTALRVPPSDEAYLSLAEIAERARAAARAAGTDATHFRAIQLPFNVHMADAFTVAAHETTGETVSALSFAEAAGLQVVTSASLMQGELAASGAIPDDVAARLAGDAPAQQALNFARSAPGVTCSLVGTTDPTHVAENVAAGTFDPMGANAFDAVFE